MNKKRFFNILIIIIIFVSLISGAKCLEHIRQNSMESNEEKITAIEYVIQEYRDGKWIELDRYTVYKTN